MTAGSEDLIVEFTSVRENYNAYCKSVSGLIERLLSVNGIAVHSITQRCKTVESLSRKVEKKSTYDSLVEITDLAGIRIITLFSEDVDVVAKLIEREFTIDLKNSIDKRASLDPDRFGYLSLHYVASLNNSRGKLQEYSGFGKLKIEIQIRSILQHTWAEIEHDIGYKSTVEVPRQIRRRFSRLAGLLELADQEFIGIRKDLDAYALSIKEQMKGGGEEVLIDKVTLSNFIETNKFCSKVDGEIAEIRQTSLGFVSASSRMIKNLEYVGIIAISSLEAKVRELYPEIMRRVQDVVKVSGSPPKSIGQGTCIFFLIQVLVAQRKDRGFIDEFVLTNEWSEDFAEYLMNF